MKRNPCDNISPGTVDGTGPIPIIRALATVFRVISGLWGAFGPPATLAMGGMVLLMNYINFSMAY